MESSSIIVNDPGRRIHDGSSVNRFVLSFLSCGVPVPPTRPKYDGLNSTIDIPLNVDMPIEHEPLCDVTGSYHRISSPCTMHGDIRQTGLPYASRDDDRCMSYDDGSGSAIARAMMVLLRGHRVGQMIILFRQSNSIVHRFLSNDDDGRSAADRSMRRCQESFPHGAFIRRPAR